MDASNENVTLLSRDLDSNSEMTFKHRVFNFYYQTLRKKSISLLLLTFFMIFETVELVSYAFIEAYRPVWKVKDSSMDYIQLILGATRITPLMKYLTFNYYFIVFCFLIAIIFLNFLMVGMTLSFNRPESKFYAFAVSFTSYVTSNLCVFFLVPMSEVMMLMLKCKDNKVDIVKESVECFTGMHFLYVVLAVVMMILFLCLIIMNAVFNFNPLNANKPTTIINPTADTFLVIFKIVLVFLYVLISNDWISIIIMVLGSLLNLKNAWENPTYNSYFLQCMVSVRNGSVFWTFLVLFIGKIVGSGSKFNGMIYLLVVGYPFIVMASIFYYRYLRNEFCEGKSNFKNVSEFLMRVNYLKVLIDAFISKNMSNKGGSSFNNLRKKEILLRGQIAIHEESCTNEECPLKKFLENQGNFQVQKTSLLHYMNILFNEAIKKFPDSQLILMTFVQFNFDKKYNLNAAKMYLSKLERFKNTLTEDYILFFIKKSVAMIGSKYGEDEMVRIEDTPQHKFKRFKLLIDAATKLYGEFWGNLATNLTNNLNLNKLFYVGNKLNDYLHELTLLWEEFKNKKLEPEQQNIVQLYCLFLREIIKNRAKADEIAKKLNEEQNFEVHKTESDKVDMNNLDNILENQDYIIYGRCNDMGHCTILQCSNSIISLLGFQKQEIIGKKIETVMPMLVQLEHAKMLSGRLKTMRVMMNSNKENLKMREKKQIFILMKNKVGYLTALNARFGIYNDDDFSNTFIIKTKLELKDPKVVYAYYIFTKADFTIDSISSSSINLGLTMDLLKKHLINLNNLIRSNENEPINIIEHIAELEEESQMMTWVFPDKVYPKADINNNNGETDMEKLIADSPKKKLMLTISTMKMYGDDPFGYCFKFTECENANCGNSGNGLRNENGFDMNGFQEFSQKFMLYDISRLNYIRAELVKEKTKKVEEVNENQTSLNTSTNKSILVSSGLVKKTGTKELISEDTNKDEKERRNSESQSSEEKEAEKENQLTKEKIQEFHVKTSEEIKAFIKTLNFYGKDIFLKKKLPNKEENNAGYSIEPNINITLDDFIKRIDRSKLLDKRQVIRPPDEAINIDSTTTSDISYISSSTASLNNLFSKQSIFSIKIIGFAYFGLILIVLSVEFAIGYQTFRDLKRRVYYSRLGFDLLEYLMYTKYLVTEAILGQNTTYPIYGYTEGSRTPYVYEMMDELSQYRLNITNTINYFSNATVTFSKEYNDFIDSTQVYIRTLTNGKPSIEYQPFWTGIGRIPTSIFYVSTVTNNVSSINMEDRNAYELVMNLLNDYFILWRKVAMILVKEIRTNTEMNKILIAMFIISFVILVIFGIVSHRALTIFLKDGTRPVDLIMTIKKTKFEELKVTCESFLNKLLNKFIGNEEMDDENQGDANYDISSDDIVISKFKSRNQYNQSINSNKTFLSIFIGIIFFFIIFECYFVFKYVYTKQNLSHIYHYVEVHNITHYSECDLVLSYNIAKSYFYNKEIPILNETDTQTIFQNTLSNLSDTIESLIKTTYSKMKYLNKDYTDYFYKSINEDITSVNKGGYSETDFYGTMLYGFKTLVLRYFELIRYPGLEHFMSNSDKNFTNDKDYAEAGALLKDVIRPWYLILKTKLNDYYNKYCDNIELIVTALFIVFLFVLIVVYLLVWKTIEDKLEVYLKSSIDLINLIPEEIKFQMIIKLNEEEQKENKD